MKKFIKIAVIALIVFVVFIVAYGALRLFRISPPGYVSQTIPANLTGNWGKQMCEAGEYVFFISYVKQDDAWTYSIIRMNADGNEQTQV